MKMQLCQNRALKWKTPTEIPKCSQHQWVEKKVTFYVVIPSSNDYTHTSCSTHIKKRKSVWSSEHVPCGIDHEAFFLYTMQNMQNSQLPCFKPYLPIAFPSLSPLHLPSLSSHNSYSSISCFVVLPAFTSFLRHPLQLYVVFKAFLIF